MAAVWRASMDGGSTSLLGLRGMSRTTVLTSVVVAAAATLAKVIEKDGGAETPRPAPVRRNGEPYVAMASYGEAE